MTSVILKPKREKSLLRRHPWIFSGAVARTEGKPEAGETVDIKASDGTLCGRGAWSPKSQIVIRAWTFSPDEEIGPQFFRSRLERAIRSRGTQIEKGCGRLVNAEADGLPGLIVDRYADFLVCQFLAAGAEFWRETIVSLLAEILPVQGIYERSDADVRQKEGLAQRTGVLAGEQPPDLVEICEGKLRFLVDVKQGHKTGFYLDQRENRIRVAAYATGAEVLNCFSYTGGFAVAALDAGAKDVINVDASAPALELARRNMELNGQDLSAAENVEGDVFAVLRKYRDMDRRFDLIVLDPPKFAESRTHLEKACRGYKDINLLAFKMLRPGGILSTFSCSGLVDRDIFDRTIAYAALDAGCEAQVLHRLEQAPDHPASLSFPEGSYLKGLICRVW